MKKLTAENPAIAARIVARIAMLSVPVVTFTFMSDRHRSVRLAAAVFVAVLAAPLAAAQETSSQLSGFVVGEDGLPIAGASVTIVHIPSGTTSTTTTTASGQFSATGLRVGGPYRVTAQAEGMQDAIVEELYTQLAQRTSVTLVAQPIATLAGVEVTGSSERDVSIGAGARFGAQDVRALPSISRDIKDVVRVNPKAWVDPTNSDALEVAGVNNRYNSITVDGVRQNDDFGLNNNGYPTQRSPLSVDAVEAVSVLTAPFSVEYSFFRGSTINMVTKSGTNEFTGSAFFYKGDDSYLGDQTKDTEVNLVFDEEIYGGTLGGPIIKDKLFFFLSYEKLEREAPQDIGPTGSDFPVQKYRMSPRRNTTRSARSASTSTVTTSARHSSRRPRRTRRSSPSSTGTFPTRSARRWPTSAPRATN